MRILEILPSLMREVGGLFVKVLKLICRSLQRRPDHWSKCRHNAVVSWSPLYHTTV